MKINGAWARIIQFLLRLDIMHSFRFIWTQKKATHLLVGAGSAGGGAGTEEVRKSVLRPRGIVGTLWGAEPSKRGNNTVWLENEQQGRKEGAKKMRLWSNQTKQCAYAL